MYDPNSEEAKAERQARRDMKAARGDFKTLAPVSSGAMRVGLVRDKNGRPKFDTDPRKLPNELKEAFGAMMTEDERTEFFG